MNSGLTERRHRAQLGGRRVVSRTLPGLVAVSPVRGRPMSLGLSTRVPGRVSLLSLAASSSLAASRVEAVTISIIVVGCAVVAVVHLLIMEWFERVRRARARTQSRSATTGAGDQDQR
jgi:hypothetical protein